jgi:hypothetical protein
MQQEKRRRTTSITIDGRILDKIKLIAEDRGITVSKYIEEYFFNEFKRTGIIPPDMEQFRETRGGDRTKSTND